MGYLTTWGTASLTEAARHGYNIIVIAFGQINENSGKVDLKFCDSKFSDTKKFIAEVDEIKR